MENQQEAKNKKKNSIAWKPLAMEAGKILLIGIVQGAALAAGGKLAEVSLRRRTPGEIVSINRKAI